VDPLPFAWDAVVQGSAELDRASNALREVLSWATMHHLSFRSLPARDAVGDTLPNAWLGEGENRAEGQTLAVLLTELRSVLEGRSTTWTRSYRPRRNAATCSATRGTGRGRSRLAVRRGGASS
jgi:hypothetical protein